MAKQVVKCSGIINFEITAYTEDEKDMVEEIRSFVGSLDLGRNELGIHSAIIEPKSVTIDFMEDEDSVEESDGYNA